MKYRLYSFPDVTDGRDDRIDLLRLGGNGAEGFFGFIRYFGSATNRLHRFFYAAVILLVDV